MKNKKIITLSIALATATIPTAMVVACGTKENKTTNKTEDVTVRPQETNVLENNDAPVDLQVSEKHDKEWGHANYMYPSLTEMESKNLMEFKERQKTGQPFTMHFHTRDLAKWKVGADTDDAFNQATIPLQKRELAPSIMDSQKEYKLDILDGLQKNTSYSKNGTSERTYSDNSIFSMWSNLNSITSWGGSSSEGTVVLPKASDINAAHKNGVPINATLFIPPEQYGGSYSMYGELVEKNNGKFTAADNMIEMAKHYGFDGWFLNFESSGVTYTNALREWLQYFHDEAKKAGISVQLYNGNVGVGSQLAGTRAWDSLALDYGNSNPGYDESKVTYGYDSVNALNGNDIFRDRNVWVYGYTGAKDVASVGDEWNMQFFTSSDGASDPRIDGTDRWIEPTKSYRQNTIINGDKSFVTTFNNGFGKNWFNQGKEMTFGYQGTNGWRNSGLQSVMPTWRYVADEYSNTDFNKPLNRNGNKVTKITTDNVDWKTSIEDNGAVWDGSSSLHYKGKIGANKSIVNRLYGSDITVKDSQNFEFIYKNINSNNIIPDLAIWTTSSNPVIIKGNVESLTNGFSKVVYDLSSLKGQKIVSFGTSLSNGKNETEDADVSIGQIKFSAGDNSNKETLKSIKNDGSFLFIGTRQLRLSWETTNNAEIDHYVIYGSDDQSKFERNRVITVSSNNSAYITNINSTLDFINMTIVGVNASGDEVLSKQIKAHLK